MSLGLGCSHPVYDAVLRRGQLSIIGLNRYQRQKGEEKKRDWGRTNGCGCVGADGRATGSFSASAQPQSLAPDQLADSTFFAFTSRRKRRGGGLKSACLPSPLELPLGTFFVCLKSLLFSLHCPSLTYVMMARKGSITLLRDANFRRQQQHIWPSSSPSVTRVRPRFAFLPAPFQEPTLNDGSLELSLFHRRRPNLTKSRFYRGGRNRRMNFRALVGM